MMKEKMIKRIKKEMKDLRKQGVILFLINSGQYLDINTTILKSLVSDESSGIYVTLNRPYESLVEMLKESKINTERIFFIDCITKIAGKGKEAKNVLYLDSPQNLTSLSLIIEEAGKALPSGSRFMVLDALTTLTVYNSTETVLKFLHFLTNKIRIMRLDGVLLSVNKELEPMIQEQVEQFVDKIINMSD